MDKNESSFFDLMLRELFRDGKIGGMANKGYGVIDYKLLNYELKPELAEKFIEEKKEDIKKYIEAM
jgi:hypothetical protein